MRWSFAFFASLAGFTSAAAQDPNADFKDYDQWKLALSSAGAPQPATIKTLPGFTVDVVRVAQPSEGSWISLAFDARGRLVVGREDRGLMRLTLAKEGGRVDLVEKINDTLLECRGLLFAHGALYVNANNSKGFYRLRDVRGNDRFDEVKLLRRLEGDVGHGRNGLALGPDGKIYLTLGNNVHPPRDTAASSPYRNYGLDRLLPCPWNEFLFDADVRPPCGHIVRTDPEGKTWELFAGGFRNPYGIAFNPEGELFTYDADMEWDVGAPWYRPTCILHVVSGGEYGWRQGTSVWPPYFADSLPRVVDVGLGSPTGVKFGTSSHFPGVYRRALFVLDWAYGRILAVHLSPTDGTYAGQVETFVKGKPLNATDLAFGPDGAMYFVVGGRRTQSTLYRVRWTGGESPGAPAKTERETAEASKIRREIEQFHQSDDSTAVDALWLRLGGADRWVRNAARVALERRPVAAWRDRALSETESTTALNALLALARVGGRETQAALLHRLNALAKTPLSDEDRLIALRVYELSFIRQGAPEPSLLAETRAVASQWHPASGVEENQLLCELLVHLKDPAVVPKTLALLDQPLKQEEQLFLLYTLRLAENGWTTERRVRYFQHLRRADGFRGAQYLGRYVTFIRTDALARVPQAERAKLALLGAPAPAAATGTTQSRAVIRKWTITELAPQLDLVAGGRNFVRGKAAFEAACIRCHAMAGRGTPLGPDLTQVASRFGRREVLESILAPSKVVDDKYRNWVLETSDGKTLVGQFVGVDAETLTVAPSLLEPEKVVRISRSSIVRRHASNVSPMPEGLLDVYTAEEILDLLAYVEAGGASAHANFRSRK